MDTIVVGYDGSEYSDRALDRAVEIGKSMGAGLRVVSAVKVGQAAHARSGGVGPVDPGDAEDLAEALEKGGAGSPTRVSRRRWSKVMATRPTSSCPTPRITTLGSSSSAPTASTSPGAWSRAPSRRRSPSRRTATCSSFGRRAGDRHHERRRPLGRPERLGRRRPVRLRARRRGRLLDRPGRGPERPLPRHDLRQPGRWPVVDAGRPVRDRRFRSRHARAHGRARARACRTSSAPRWAVRSRRSSRSRIRSGCAASSSTEPGAAATASCTRSSAAGSWAAQKAGFDPRLPRRRQPVVLRAANLERRDDGRLARRCRGEPASAVGRCVLPLGRGADRARHAPTALGDVAAPTLVTVGELDLVLPERFSREIVSRIQGAWLEVIAGAGHQPFQELPDDYNRLLARVLERPPGRGGATAPAPRGRGARRCEGQSSAWRNGDDGRRGYPRHRSASLHDSKPGRDRIAPDLPERERVRLDAGREAQVEGAVARLPGRSTRARRAGGLDGDRLRRARRRRATSHDATAGRGAEDEVDVFAEVARAAGSRPAPAIARSRSIVQRPPSANAFSGTNSGNAYSASSSMRMGEPTMLSSRA